MKQFFWMVLVLAAGMLAGCVNPGSIMPNTAADDLVKKLGKPTDTRRNAQGGESWDYVNGPEGVTTWRYVIDNNRTVRSVEQLVTHERLYKVVPGETNEAGVIELLGRPGMVTKYSHEVAWEWRANLSPNNGYFIVRFGHDGIARGVGVLTDLIMDSASPN